MSFPGFADLYALFDPLGTRAYRGSTEAGDAALAAARCEAGAIEPVLVIWDSGAAEPGDIIWTSAALPLFVSTRVVDILEENRFTGWRTYPAQVQNKSGRDVPGYFGLAISGRCGPVDLTRSAIELREYPGGWAPLSRGHFFVPDTWDGSDIFMESPDALGRVTGSRFVTGRVKQALMRGQVRNLSFARLSELSTDVAIYTIGRKHLLPKDYQARITEAYERARVPRPDWV